MYSSNKNATALIKKIQNQTNKKERSMDAVPPTEMLSTTRQNLNRLALVSAKPTNNVKELQDLADSLPNSGKRHAAK